jgi:hypothetical protein
VAMLKYVVTLIVVLSLIMIGGLWQMKSNKGSFNQDLLTILNIMQSRFEVGGKFTKEEVKKINAFMNKYDNASENQILDELSVIYTNFSMDYPRNRNNSALEQQEQAKVSLFYLNKLNQLKETVYPIPE